MSDDREWMRGSQWTPEELEKMNRTALAYGGTVTGRVSGGPMPLNQIKQRPQLDPVDVELLNRLRQPTYYQQRIDRRDALDRMVYHSTRGLQSRFAGDEVDGKFHLSVAESYKTKYNFTEKEINARLEETSRYVQGGV